MNNQHLDYRSDNANYQTMENELYLKDYVIILRIHLKKIIIIFLIALSLGVYSTFSKIPKYRASATIMVTQKPGSQSLQSFGNSDNNVQIINNKILLLKSRGLLESVVKDYWDSNRRNNMFLFNTRKFFPKGQAIRTLLKEIFTLGLYDAEKFKETKVLDGFYKEEIGQKYAKVLQRNLSVGRKGGTNMIWINYESENADEARRIVNTIVRRFEQKDKEWTNKYAINSISFLDSLVNIQEKKIENAENKKMEFMLEHDLFSMEANSDVIISQINDYEMKLYDIETEISIQQKQMDVLKSKFSKQELNLTSSLMDNINIQLSSLRNEVGRIESQIALNSGIYGDTHGSVIALNEKHSLIKEEINKKASLLIEKGITTNDPLLMRNDQISQILALENSMMALKLNKDQNEKMLDLFKNKLNSIPETNIIMERMNREDEILNEHYLQLVNTLETTKMNNVIEKGDVQIVDLAKKPSRPFTPNHQKDIIIFCFFGLGIAIVIVFLIEFIDNTIKTIDEIEKYDKSVIGVIPAIGKISSRGIISRYLESKSFTVLGGEKGIKRKIITRDNPKSPISESYRGLRTNILLTNTKDIKSILVSSAGPGEGKTTTVANLAITFANLGRKTLLVDTDLRRPVIHSVFNVKREPGVTNYLSGQTDDYHSLVKPSEIENLSLLTSGLIPPNPSEMLGSKKMSQFIKKLESDWDMILFDSPPLVAVTDATMISKEIDSIILVIKAGQTDKKAFHHTMANLKNIEAPLDGIVMNAVTSKSNYGSYYYYYYHQYYHYYSSHDNESDA
ncbi:MAG: hypothetical protein CMF99_01570 [Candidatus Marinimicrobia bacterium]|nr:hypothetical protein [Candidatus Neomarinimicrobiota bacterium]